MAGLMRPVKIEQRQVLLKVFHINETTGTPALDVGATDGALQPGCVRPLRAGRSGLLEGEPLDPEGPGGVRRAAVGHLRGQVVMLVRHAVS